MMPCECQLEGTCGTRPASLATKGTDVSSAGSRGARSRVHGWSGATTTINSSSRIVAEARSLGISGVSINSIAAAPFLTSSITATLFPEKTERSLFA